MFADGREHVGDIGEIRFRIGGKERTTTVAFGKNPTVRLLGAVTLESFGLIADTTRYRLIPSRRLLFVGMRRKIVQGRALAG